MGDPLRPLNPGDPRPRTVRTWNAILDAARAHRAGGRRPGVPLGSAGWGCVEALALNDTGADLREYKPAKVTDSGGYDLTTEVGYDWSRRPVLTIGTPSAASDVVAVTLEAIPDGQFGRVAVAGWCLCDVDVSSSGHEYASPGTDTDALVSGSTGSIRILNTGTGTARRCAVYLGDQVAAATDWFTAMLTSDTAPYSWKERVQSSPGVYSDGPRSGTSNARAMNYNGASFQTAPLTNDFVMMRASGTTSGYEFLPADAGFPLCTSNVLALPTALASSTPVDVCSISLGVGKWLVSYSMGADVLVNAVNQGISAQLVVISGTGTLTTGALTYPGYSHTTSVRVIGQSAGFSTLTATTGVDVALRATRFGGGTFTNATVTASGATQILAHRVNF